MTKTHTPLIIEGKIYVVEQIIPPDEYALCYSYELYKRDFKPQTLPTLPEHAPYWKERIGQRVEVEIVHLLKGVDDIITPYAIPPQQKQGDFYCRTASSGYDDKCTEQCRQCELVVHTRQSRTQELIAQDDGDLWDEVEEENLPRPAKSEVMELKEKQILDAFIAYMTKHHPNTPMEHMLVIYPKGVIVDFIQAYGKEQYNQALIDAAGKYEHLNDVVTIQSILNLKKH